MGGKHRERKVKEKSNDELALTLLTLFFAIIGFSYTGIWLTF